MPVIGVLIFRKFKKVNILLDILIRISLALRS
jgi:hypothetical protein